MNAQGDKLLVRVVKGIVQFEKIDDKGNVSKLSEEEVKTINPMLNHVDSNGQVISSIPLVHGQKVPA